MADTLRRNSDPDQHPRALSVSLRSGNRSPWGRYGTLRELRDPPSAKRYARGLVAEFQRHMAYLRLIGAEEQRTALFGWVCDEMDQGPAPDFLEALKRSAQAGRALAEAREDMSRSPAAMARIVREARRTITANLALIRSAQAQQEDR